MRYEKYREKFRIMNWRSQGINLIDFLNVIKDMFYTTKTS